MWAELPARAARQNAVTATANSCVLPLKCMRACVHSTQPGARDGTTPDHSNKDALPVHPDAPCRYGALLAHLLPLRRSGCPGHILGPLIIWL